MKNFLTIPALLFSTFAFAQQPAQKIVLSKGQKITIADSVTMSIVQEAMGQSMEIPGNTYTTTLLEVKETAADKNTITSTMKKVSFYMNMMGQEMNYDSDNPTAGNADAAKAYEEKLNKPETVIISASGKVIKDEKASPEKKETGNDAAGSVDMIKGLGSAASDNVAETAFMILPEGIKKGSSWSDSSMVEGVKTNRTYIIKSLENNIAVVTLLGVLSGSRKMELQGMEMNMAIGGKIEGEIIMDISTGMIKKRTTVLEPNNSIEVMGMSVPVTGKITTVTTYHLSE